MAEIPLPLPAITFLFNGLHSSKAAMCIHACFTTYFSIIMCICALSREWCEFKTWCGSNAKVDLNSRSEIFFLFIVIIDFPDFFSESLNF